MRKREKKGLVSITKTYADGTQVVEYPEGGAQQRACPVCGTLFMATRKDRKFCGALCRAISSYHKRVEDRRREGVTER